VLDQLGKFDEARQYYASALKIVPNEPAVLSNLGMSYLLSKDLAKAEEILGRAYEHAKTDPRVRMNFAVVLSLEGRHAEAENLLKADLPPDEGNARVAELKRLLIKKDGKPERNASRAPGTTAAKVD
jgi:Flp pilus assembly protein TadD